MEAYQRYAEDQAISQRIDLPTIHSTLTPSLPGGLSTYASHLEQIALLDARRTSEEVAFDPPPGLLPSSYSFSSMQFRNLNEALEKLRSLDIPKTFKNLMEATKKIEAMISLVKSLQTVKKM